MLKVAAFIAACSASALAQDHVLEVRVLNDATPARPFVQFEVWAHFAPEEYAWSAARYDLYPSEPGFHAADSCMCETALVIEPGRIWVHSSQAHFPPVAYAHPANPIYILRAWWHTGDFTPRTVALTTDSDIFAVYPRRELKDGELRLDRLVEPGAVIRVLDRECYVDCDASGDLDFLDFLCFQNLYAASDPLADCDLDGQLDFFDFLCFQNEFVAGCP